MGRASFFTDLRVEEETHPSHIHCHAAGIDGCVKSSSRNSLGNGTDDDGVALLMVPMKETDGADIC